MTTNSPIYGVTKSQLMTRAWELARRTRRTLAASLKTDFGRWLAFAWAEAREGELQFWPMNANPRASLQHEIDCLNGKDRWSADDYQIMRALSAELTALSAY